MLTVVGIILLIMALGFAIASGSLIAKGQESGAFGTLISFIIGAAAIVCLGGAS